jgi:hypothetical protein
LEAALVVREGWEGWELWSGPVTASEAEAGHAFAQAALLEEIFLEVKQLLVDEVIGLMDKAEGDVGNDVRRSGFNELAVEVVVLWCASS